MPTKPKNIKSSSKTVTKATKAPAVKKPAKKSTSKKVAVVEMAPFPLILGADWLGKANISLVCKDNQIVPVFIKHVEKEAAIPDEVKEPLPSEEFFQNLA